MTQRLDIDAWQAAGQTIPVALGDGRHNVFARVSGHGGPVTMLHGFPTSSIEWQGVLGALEAEHRVLAADFLGFGISDKPAARYSIARQADLVEELWRELDISTTAIVGYDYGGMVAMELLARSREGRLRTGLDRVVLLNTAIFSDTYRPRLLTRLMAHGPQAPLLGRLLNERTVTRSWSEVFSADHPLEPELAQDFWDLLQRDADRRPLQRLLHFVPERRAYARRWDDAIAYCPVPLHLIWGLADLVSGSDAGIIPQRLPGARLIAMDDIGHAPHLEDPPTTARHLLTALC